ncbi:hypothetical protein C8R42DRAFT_720588 [Lentinula raphanica]|nr:hypothetical protein C8R42DRAFT_720588 [Lentinula raphanica]
MRFALTAYLLLGLSAVVYARPLPAQTDSNEPNGVDPVSHLNPRPPAPATGKSETTTGNSETTTGNSETTTGNSETTTGNSKVTKHVHFSDDLEYIVSPREPGTAPSRETGTSHSRESGTAPPQKTGTAPPQETGFW